MSKIDKLKKMVNEEENKGYWRLEARESLDSLYYATKNLASVNGQVNRGDDLDKETLDRIIKSLTDISNKAVYTKVG